MPQDDLAGDRQPKTNARKERARLAGAAERFEDSITLFGWNPHALVGDSNDRLGVLGERGHDHASPTGGVLDGIAHQVGEHLLDPRRIEVRDQRFRGLDEDEFVRGCDRPIEFDHLADNRTNVERLPPQLEAPGFDPRRIEQIAHHAVQALDSGAPRSRACAPVSRATVAARPIARRRWPSSAPRAGCEGHGRCRRGR